MQVFATASRKNPCLQAVQVNGAGVQDKHPLIPPLLSSPHRIQEVEPGPMK